MKSDIAIAVRTLLRSADSGALSTVSPDGHPYASLHAIATAQDGRPLFLFSDLSQHTRNARAEPRAALLVQGRTDETPTANPQELPRACISGRLQQIEDPDLLARYIRRHPSADMYAGFGDFNLFELSLDKARYVGGFAQAASVDRSLALDADLARELTAAELGMLEHMNEDHQEAIDHYASLLGNQQTGWSMNGIDAEGCDLVREGVRLRLTFPEALQSVEDARVQLVKLARRS